MGTTRKYINEIKESLEGEEEYVHEWQTWPKVLERELMKEASIVM